METILLYNVCLMFSGSHKQLLKLQYERNILPTLYRQVRILGKHYHEQHDNLVKDLSDEDHWRAWISRERERRILNGVWCKSQDPPLS